MSRAAITTLVAAAIVALSTTSSCPVITPAAAFDKRYPQQAPHGAEYRDKLEEIAKSNAYDAKDKKRVKISNEEELRMPGTYDPETYALAMPDFNDPYVDGPELECSACLTVADIVSNRFSTLKNEFRVNMENIKPYHVDAALDDMCVKEHTFMGLLVPNMTNTLGQRGDRQYRIERMAKEDEILLEAKRRYGEKQRKIKKSKKSAEAIKKAEEEEKAKRRKRNAGKSEQEIKWADEEAEWKKYSLDKYAVARRKRLRMNFTIWSEYADERQIKRKVNAVPQDITLLRNTKIHSEWQRYCNEALVRMEEFGLVRVFRGSRTFSLCPMCKKDKEGEEGTADSAATDDKKKSSKEAKEPAATKEKKAATPTTTTNDEAEDKDEADTAADELAKLRHKQDRLAKARKVQTAMKRHMVDLGDDDEDEKFIAGKGDEYEL